MVKIKEKLSKDIFPFSNIVQLVVVVALVGMSFYAGGLWMKTKPAGDAKTKVAGTEVAVPTQDAQPVVPAPQQGKKISEIASEAGVDVSAFKSCLSSGEMAGKVAEDMTSGTNAGVTGTPGSFLLDKQTGTAYFVPGAYPFTEVKKLLDDVKAGATPMLGGQAVETTTNLAAVTDEDYIRGDKNARFVLVEYSDFECPFCKRFHETAKKLQQENSDVAWVYRQFPLEQLHPTAPKTAEGSECAAKLGGNDAFWKYADGVSAADQLTAE